MSFSDAQVQQVWEKGTVVTGPEEAKLWRQDKCTAWINRQAYGKESDYGWQIDHKIPKAQGGGDELSNLQPLHWRNNAAKAAGRLDCVVTSDGNKNVVKP